MGAAIDFPIMGNRYVQGYLKALNENNRSGNDFIALLNVVEELEKLLAQSNRNMADMQRQLSELKEIQKHPIKTELNNISDAMQESAGAAKSWLGDIKESIANFCKKTMENFKDAGASALDKTASFLKLNDGLEAISRYAAHNNALCGTAINKIERFSEEYHKSGRALKNMGRMILGKEPIDDVKENGRLSKALTAPYRREKAVWAKIEQKAFVAARGLGDFHTQTQVKRIDRQDAKEVKNADKTDVFAKVNKHKETVDANKKENPKDKDKSQGKKKTHDGR